MGRCGCSNPGNGGTNVITVTLTDGSASSFTVKNGSRGSTGPQGETGQAGNDGVGIVSVVQTTASSADGGKNVITVTLSNGESSTFTVYNGSKGADADTSALEQRVADLELRVTALEERMEALEGSGSGGGSGTSQLAAPVIKLFTSN